MNDPSRKWMAENPAKTGIVLYVEDEEDDVFFMRIAFQQAGCGSLLRTLANGQEALDYLAGSGGYADRERNPPPTVLLLDLNLPAVSGFEVLEWVRNRSRFRNLPVIIFSGSIREEDRLAATNLGANAYIEKPTSPLKFLNLMEFLFERWPELYGNRALNLSRP